MNDLGLRVLPVGQLATNCYLVFDHKNDEGLIIDPGDDADYILRIITDEKIKPLKILATHGHFDHILAATELQLAYEIPFAIHKNDLFLVKSVRKSAAYFLKMKPAIPPPHIDDFLKMGQKINFGTFQLEVIETPGHTPGSVCFHLKEKNLLFCGDTIFKNGVVRTDFSYSSEANLQKSLKKLSAIATKTIFYPGHGENFTNSVSQYIVE